AQAAFGDPALYAEAFLADARHVEVQVAGDGAGGVVHLWDRECSAQRQRQKLIEIAPAPAPEPIRQTMRAAALGMARDVRYRGLGTFEFLLGSEGFFFIEANPRLQVEHT